MEIQVKSFTYQIGGDNYFIYYVPGATRWVAMDEGGLAFGDGSGDFSGDSSEIESAIPAISSWVADDGGEWTSIKKGTQIWDIIISWIS